MADTASFSPSALERMKSYVKTQKGFILAAEIILNFIILICFVASGYGGYTVAICELVFAVIFFIVFMMELDKQFTRISWIWSDLFRTCPAALIYIIMSLFCVFGGYGNGALTAGGVFGLIAGFLFVYDTYTIYLQLKRSRQHQPASTDEKV